MPTLTPARATSRPPPRYPPAARRDGVTGVVTLAIQVDASGHILAVRIVESDPAGVFDDAAIESVRAWRFTPATRDGAPVTTWVRQTIRFTLEAS
jgi:protein TonB